MIFVLTPKSLGHNVKIHLKVAFTQIVCSRSLWKQGRLPVTL